MASKLTWHFQTVPGWAAGMVNAEWVKIIDPPHDNLFPACKTIGRVYVPDNEANAMIMCGVAGAADFYSRCLPAMDRAPYVYAWEGPNEPPVQTAQQRKMLCEFTRAWNYLMHSTYPHRKTVALNLSVGWPDIGDAPSLADALAEADYMGLHEYSAPSMLTDCTWTCLRYRRTVLELQQAGVQRIPPILITETGIDGGVNTKENQPLKPKHGWKSYTDRSGYMNQLKWYDGELRKDPYVKAATIFTSGPNWDWTDFDVDLELSKDIHDHIASNPPEETDVTPAIIMPQPHLIWPMDGKVEVTQGFGNKNIVVDGKVVFDYYSKFGLYAHNGLDLWQEGSPKILAMHDGQCMVYDDPAGYGHTVEIWHPDISHGIWKTIYAHLADWLVKDNQLVRAGMAVGIMGRTGNVTGPHLHTGIKLLKGVNPGYRGWTDLVPYLW